jgi:hypothetical protein
MLFGIVLTCAMALLLNVPLGVWREHVRKFSVQWFVAVHASIPLIMAMRHLFGMSMVWIPLTFGLAVAGQMIGGRLMKKGRVVVGTWQGY